MRLALSKMKQLASKLIFLTVGYVISTIIYDGPSRADDLGLRLQFASKCGLDVLFYQAKRDERLAGKVFEEKYRTMRGTVMIGIMTTRENLLTRATAISSTWGKDLPGLVFYVGETPGVSPGADQAAGGGLGTSDNGQDGRVPEKEDTTTGQLHRQQRQQQQPQQQEEQPSPPDDVDDPEPVRLMHDLPVVELKGVHDDAYPPRNKSFAMLRHMDRAFGARFEWLARADDDVYIRHEALTLFLRSLDSSRLWYIGRAGYGKLAERGRLGLDPKRPYCMGGTGVVFSPSALRLLVPHLQQCNNEGAVTTHEDTELGRCLLEHVNVSCTAGKETDILFRAVFKTGEKEIMSKQPHSLLTLHPIKEPHTMHLFHTKVNLERLQHLMRRFQYLTMAVSSLKMQAEAGDAAKHSAARTDSDPSKFDARKDIQDFLGAKKVDALTGAFLEEDATQRLLAARTATSRGEDAEKTGSSEGELLLTDNPLWECSVSVRGDHVHLSEEKNVHTSRYDAIKQADAALNAFLVKSKLRRKIRRRSAAMFQSLSQLHGLQHLITRKHNHGGYQSFMLTSRFKELYFHELHVHSNYDAILLNPVSEGKDAALAPLQNENLLNEARALSGRYGDKVSSSWPDIHILMPLLGRHEIYNRFLNYTAVAASRYAGKVSLAVGLYEDDSGDYSKSLTAADRLHDDALNTTVVTMAGPFSRARTFNKLAEPFKEDSGIVVFMDVDLVFTEHFLYRCAMNVGLGRAYFPVVFSQHAPETVCYRRSDCSPNVFNFSEEAGKWRLFGYGMLAITLADLRRAGGVNNDYVGWGGEDFDFYQRCKKAGIEIVRAPDKDLVHVYHPMTCDGIKEKVHKEACTRSKSLLYGSSKQLGRVMMDIENS